MVTLKHKSFEKYRGNKNKRPQLLVQNCRMAALLVTKCQPTSTSIVTIAIDIHYHRHFHGVIILSQKGLSCINHLPLVFIIFKMHFLLEHYHVMHELLVNLFLLSKGNVFLGTSCISTLHLTFIVIVVLVPSYFNGV